MFLTKLKSITTFIFDIDGVLTNGQLTATESGELLRTFNVKDGYAMRVALNQGYKIWIISGGKGVALEKRFTALGIKDIFLGIDFKIEVFQSLTNTYQVTPDQILYMGDDIPDLAVMQRVGIASCPANAVEEVKAASLYISPKNGGEGAARDVIEKVLKVQGKWHNADISAAKASI